MSFLFVASDFIPWEQHTDNVETEVKDEDLPPLVKKKITEDNQQATSQAKLNTVNVLIDKQNEMPMYLTFDLDLDKELDDLTVPPLVNCCTGEIVKEEPSIEEEEEETEPIVYKKLIAQGVTVEIPEKMVKEIPYIETLFSGRFTVSEEEGIVKSDEIDPELLKIILKYLQSEKKLYKLLACLPKHCDVYKLFELLHFLAIKPPITITKESIKDKLTSLPSIMLNTQKELVEYAFAIFHGYHFFDYRKERKTRDNIYDVISYVFKSGRDSFKPRAKYHLLKLAKKCVLFSFNQFQKIKVLKVSDSLEHSDAESVSSDEDDWHDDCCDYMGAYLDSDDEMAMMFGHALGLHGYGDYFHDHFDNWFDHGNDYDDYEDDESDDDFLN